MMHAGVAVLLAWFVAASALAQSAAPAAAPDLQAMAVRALAGDPGSASVAVWRDGQMTHGSAFSAGPGATTTSDPATATPLYEIGSISKVFTGLLLAQAVEAGDLALGDTLGGLLRGEVAFAAPEVAAITLRQLVTHSSCLPRQFGDLRSGADIAAQIRTADRAALWAALASQTLPRAGPCPAQYSNYGMAVVGELLSRRYAKPWADLVRERIADPLGMLDTRVHLAGQSPRLAAGYNGRRRAEPWEMRAFAGAGGLRSSAVDMVTFGRALLMGRDGPLGAAAERVLVPLGEYAGGQIGYAVFVDGPTGRRTYSHDGLTGGYRSLLTMAADTGEVRVALASNGQAAVFGTIADWMAARYPVTDVVVPVDAGRLAAYAAVYRVMPSLAFTVVAQDGALHVRSTNGIFRAYLPVGPDRFTRPAGGAQITFMRSGDSSVTSMVLEQSGRSTAARRTGDPVPERPVLRSGEATPYVGRYVATRLLRDAIEFDVREESGQMLVRSSAFAWEPVFPVAGQVDRFRYQGAAELQFERDGAGKVLALVLHQNGELRALRSQDGN